MKTIRFACSVVVGLGIVVCLASACGGGGSSTGCSSDLASYCQGHECPAFAAWSADGGVTAPLTQGGGGMARSCNGLSYFTESASIDQSDDFYYDATGKLVAVAGWESAAPCSGSCRYSCFAGPSGFDPCAVPAAQRSH